MKVPWKTAPRKSPASAQEVSSLRCVIDSKSTIRPSLMDWQSFSESQLPRCPETVSLFVRKKRAMMGWRIKRESGGWKEHLHKSLQTKVALLGSRCRFQQKCAAAADAPKSNKGSDADPKSTQQRVLHAIHTRGRSSWTRREWAGLLRRD